MFLQTLVNIFLNIDDFLNLVPGKSDPGWAMPLVAVVKSGVQIKLCVEIKLTPQSRVEG